MEPHRGSSDTASGGTARRHRWFPGYTVAGAATIAFIASGPGQTFLVSQLNGPLREAFGIGELALNSSYAIATVAASLPLVLVGRLADRLGPRRALAGCAVAFGLACLAIWFHHRLGALHRRYGLVDTVEA